MGHGREFLSGVMCAEGMGCGRRWVMLILLGKGTSRLASRSVLKDFRDEALTTSAATGQHEH